MMIWVVVRENFFFIVIAPLEQSDFDAGKKHKGTSGLCSQLVPLLIFYYYTVFL